MPSEYAAVETPLRKTLVVDHKTAAFPMKKLHHLAGGVHKYIYIPVAGFQIQVADFTAQTVRALAHVRGVLAHHETVAFI